MPKICMYTTICIFFSNVWKRKSIWKFNKFPTHKLNYTNRRTNVTFCISIISHICINIRHSKGGKNLNNQDVLECKTGTTVYFVSFNEKNVKIYIRDHLLNVSQYLWYTIFCIFINTPLFLMDLKLTFKYSKV